MSRLLRVAGYKKGPLLPLQQLRQPPAFREHQVTLEQPVNRLSGLFPSILLQKNVLSAPMPNGTQCSYLVDIYAVAAFVLLGYGYRYIYGYNISDSLIQRCDKLFSTHLCRSQNV